MDSDNQLDILGKKIFFLHPSIVIQNEVVFELIQQEYETYIIKDRANLRRALKQYPNSILFVDISEGLAEQEWEAWIRELMQEFAVPVGIVSANDDETLMRKYISSVKVQGGYTVVKPDVKKSVIQLLDILNVFNAKGRRRFLRAILDNETLAVVSIHSNGSYVNGIIKDISSTGLSCAFVEDPHLGKNTLCPDIQIKLQSLLLKVEGIVFGSRMEGTKKIYVVVFTQRINPSVRAEIRKYIQNNIQAKIEEELK
jgi:hypothetical protein